MSIPTSFAATIDLPDGRRINVSIDVPGDHASTREWPDFAEHSEIAQMAASHALGVMRRADESRARRARRAAEEVPF